MLSSIRRTACIVICFACATGCGKERKKGPQLDLTPVSGTVTLDGKALADADVGFAFQGAPPADFYGSAGRTDSQGRFELQTGEQKGAVVGNYKVTVSRLVAADGATLKPEEGMDMVQLQRAGNVKQTVPAKYTDDATTELKTTVEKGKAEGYDFDLKSG